jgi:hypothetical protein
MAASEFDDLLALKKLKRLQITFSVRTPDVEITRHAVNALKKLCQRVRNCEIKFMTPRDFIFIHKLAEQLEGEKFEISFGEQEEFKCLKIKIKY